MLSIETISERYLKDVPSYDGLAITGQGWITKPVQLPSFVEPPLSAKEDQNFSGAKIWLVSAPGAVGKTTFAQELARYSGALFLDLAKAKTIGTGFITAQLFKFKMMKFVDEGKVALIMDALDEAFLRVSFESRIDFFDDLIDISKNNKYPIIIFGRPSSIEESQLILEDKDVNVNIISIDYFNQEEAVKLVVNIAKEKAINNQSMLTSITQHSEKIKSIISNILDALNKTAHLTDNHFSGYAPVLDAVAEFLCQSPNFSHMESIAKNILHESILDNICNYILEREQEKLLTQLTFDDSKKNALYTPEEQMRALCCIQSGHNISDFRFDCPNLKEEDKRHYIQAAQNFIEQHPFLKDGKHTTNEVFSGSLQAFSLKKGYNEDYNIFLQHPVSPLLAKFYFEKEEHTDLPQKPLIPASHIPFILSSYESVISQNQKISLEMIEIEDSKLIDASINLYNIENDTEKELQSFLLKADSNITFKDHIGAASITCPSLELDFSGTEFFCFTSSVDIDVKKVSFHCNEVQFMQGISTIIAEKCQSEVLRVNNFSKANVFTNWPKSFEYPWSVTSQAEKYDERDTDELKKALFSFCKLIRSFRSHSKGTLARFEDKLNHSRMTRNFGEEIRKFLEKKNVITHNIQKRMYYLNADLLAIETGVSYSDVTARNCPEKLSRILQDIIDNK